ncbi:MAG: leucine-rich repeat protein [Bacilli bacterium]|nr:leucine-rich repeat protein [Bacilli bacterium]
MKGDYEIIKKKYGERMAKACRKLFPVILDKPGALSIFLLSKFYPQHNLYQDVVENKESSFKKYVYSFFDLEYEHVDNGKSVKELMDEAGYDLYECHSNDDVQQFKKYYAEGEEICTFDDPERINKNYIFFAVKKDVDKINRKDFTKPYREDLYGTSVISIQFEKGKYNTLSIKNRYNHVVGTSDATFVNNLDNIIVGLTKAFEKEYNLNIAYEKDGIFEEYYIKSQNYCLGPDGRFYKFNNEIDGIYYCPKNVIIDHDKVLKVDSSRYKLIDYFLLDYKDKKIGLYDPNLYDSFCQNDLNSIGFDKVEKDEIILTLNNSKNENTIICVDDNSRIIGVVNNDIEKIDDEYMSKSIYTKYCSFAKCKSIGNSFMNENEDMTNIVLDNCEYIGDMFLSNNNIIKKVSFKNVKSVGEMFFQYNQSAVSVDLPSVESIGNEAFYLNEEAEYLNIPNAEHIGDGFFSLNEKIDPYFPKLKNYINSAFGSRMDVTNKMIEVINNNARRTSEEEYSKDEEATSSRRK